MVVQKSFWSMPSEKFDIYSALITDGLHQVGSTYDNLRYCAEELIMDKYGEGVLDDLKKR
jgi:hypothetical protein